MMQFLPLQPGQEVIYTKYKQWHIPCVGVCMYEYMHSLFPKRSFSPAIHSVSGDFMYHHSETCALRGYFTHQTSGPSL